MNILCIEDYADAALAQRNLLQKLGHKPTLANSQNIEESIKSAGNYDVVVARKETVERRYTFCNFVEQIRAAGYQGRIIAMSSGIAASRPEPLCPHAYPSLRGVEWYTNVIAINHIPLFNQPQNI